MLKPQDFSYFALLSLRQLIYLYIHLSRYAYLIL